MIVELNKNATKSDILHALKRIKDNIHPRRKNPFKYFGKLKWDIDPLRWQKEIRDEWD